MQLRPLDQPFVLDVNKRKWRSRISLHLDPGSPIWMLLHRIIDLGAEVPVGKGIIQVLELRCNSFARFDPFNPFAIETGDVRFET
eukprot:2997914-Rhodomonas_salina.1